MTEITADSADRSRLRVILAASIGSALEWYDFFLYGTAAALVFGELFFPKSDPVVGTLLAFLTFGVGFVVRPLGGILFGIMGDRFGRKPVLVATLLMIGLGTTLIGLLPTYAQIGYWAPTAPSEGDTEHMTKADAVDVVVVGAGIAGSAASAVL